MDETINLSTLAKQYSEEPAAWDLMERLRWPNGPVCPHCGAIGGHYFLTPKNGTRTTSTGKVTYRRLWKCSACRQQFSVLVGTIFEDSKIPLSKWLLAVHLLCSAKNGVSAHELHRTLGITYKSAWHMAHRIRYAMTQPPLTEKLQGIMEADETYIGGKAKNMHAKKREERITGTGGTDKTAIVSLVQRGGDVRSQVMRQAVNGETLAPLLREHVAKDSRLMTDSFGGYVQVGKEFADHQSVNHGKGEYVRGDAYTNTLEGYFSQLKRGIDGTHHHVSEHHLGRYVGEFDYRYNTRKIADGDRTKQTIRQSAGKRLRYRDPVEKTEGA